MLLFAMHRVREDRRRILFPAVLVVSGVVMNRFNVAIAAARSGDAQREHDAYTKALELVYEPGFRANIYMNRGESSMVLGQLAPAIEGSTYDRSSGAPSTSW